MRAPRLLLLLVLALLPAWPGGPAKAASEAETRERLEALRERIDAVRAELRRERERRDRTSAELARLEQRIGSIAGRIGELDQRLRAARRKLEELAGRRESLEASLAAHRETLAAQLRAAHRFGRQPALRLLLRQDDPGTLSRALGYYGYFNRARLDAIERARGLVEALIEVTRETRATRESLAETRAGLGEQRRALGRTREQREQVLAELQASIADRGEELDRLQASRDRLEELLEELDDVLGDIPAAPLEEQPFATRANRLDWPVDGPLRARFGEQRASGRMQWRGIVIDAEAGDPVRAIYHGRVVFADWLEGFGQLLIVDHLDGYLSLYGYNRQLLRATGDWVAPGETIARVGATGGQRRPALYFEVRRDGRPTDPLDWLVSR
jgi:septal ring factor EnvC (AmiA/AmiB activator)